MTQTELLNAIRVEIKRRMRVYFCYGKSPNQFVWSELSALLPFLDTLQEQPEVKKSNALFDECVKNCDPATMKEVSDKVDKILQEPSTIEQKDRIDEGFTKFMMQEPEVEGLDFGTFAKEIQAVFALPATETKNTENEPLNWEYAIARHFAEWGAEHLKR